MPIKKTLEASSAAASFYAFATAAGAIASGRFAHNVIAAKVAAGSNEL
jgi:hypothetical protein